MRSIFNIGTTPLHHIAQAAALCGLLASGAASAHQVWLEQDGQGAKLYFGEFGENLRETSPGLLDKFVAPVAQKMGHQRAEPLTVSKTANGFEIKGRAASGEGLVAEEPAYPVSERKEGENTLRSIYVPAARLATSFAQQAPQLTLDLVPTGHPATQSKTRVELQAFYKGKPLPKAKVMVVTASNWSQELHTDDAGKLTVDLPWRGTYVLELAYSDRTAGERGSEKYDRASYVTSLTLMQKTGLPALPASPAAVPNK